MNTAKEELFLYLTVAGLSEYEAYMLMTRFLDEEAEKFLKETGGIESER